MSKNTSDIQSIQLSLPFEFPANERWLDMPGYEGVYLISDIGRVRRVFAKGKKVDRIIKIQTHSNGYLFVHLYLHNVGKHYLVHKLVLLAFVGACPEGMQVNHINGVKADNRLNNLEYITASENIQHARDVLKVKFGATGERNGASRLTAQEVLEIRELRKQQKTTHHQLAQMYDVKPSTIQNVLNGSSWKHLLKGKPDAT